jgi:hypothetical protein
LIGWRFLEIAPKPISQSVDNWEVGAHRTEHIDAG